jgi:DNA-damage-inducible protein J
MYYYIPDSSRAARRIFVGQVANLRPIGNRPVRGAPKAPRRELKRKVRARIDSANKERAADTFAAMGLPISEAIRLLILRIVDERRSPFEIKAPNATTRKAIAELGTGKTRSFAGTAALTADLNADAFASRVGAAAIGWRRHLAAGPAWLT